LETLLERLPVVRRAIAGETGAAAIVAAQQRSGERECRHREWSPWWKTSATQGAIDDRHGARRGPHSWRFPTTVVSPAGRQRSWDRRHAAHFRQGDGGSRGRRAASCDTE